MIEFCLSHWLCLWQRFAPTVWLQAVISIYTITVDTPFLWNNQSTLQIIYLFYNTLILLSEIKNMVRGISKRTLATLVENDVYEYLIRYMFIIISREWREFCSTKLYIHISKAQYNVEKKIWTLLQLIVGAGPTIVIFCNSLWTGEGLEPEACCIHGKVSTYWRARNNQILLFHFIESSVLENIPWIT